MSIVRSISRYVVPAAVAVHIVLAILLSATLSVWVDESYSMAATSGTFAEMLHQADRFEGQPPVYFAILWVWRCINESVFWGRMLSVVFSVLAIIVSARVVRLVLSKIHPGFVIVPISVHPLTVYAATELRVSSLLLFISAVLLFLYVKAFLEYDFDRRYLLAYGFVSLVALYTHQYFGFLLVANACALFGVGRWRPLAWYMAAMAIVGLLYVPEALSVVHQVQMHEVHTPTNRGWIGMLLSMIERGFRYALPIQGVPFIEMTPSRKLFIPLILVLGAGAVLFRRRRSITPIFLALWISLAGLALAFTIATSVLGVTPPKPHHTATLFLLVHLCVFGVIQLFANPMQWRVAAVWSCVATICGFMALVDTYKPGAKTGDWKRVASYIEAHEREGQPIVVFIAESALPLAYYYHGANMLVPIPQAEDFKAYDMREQVLHGPGDIEAALQTAEPRGDTMWVVTGCDANTCNWLGIDFRIEVLEAYLADHYTLEDDTHFFKSRVRRYTAKHPDLE